MPQISLCVMSGSHWVCCPADLGSLSPSAELGGCGSTVDKVGQARVTLGGCLLHNSRGSSSSRD